jgi:endoglucanase
MNELLKQLTEASGVSGAENEVRRLIRDLIQDHVDEWSVDTMGNLIALKKGSGESAMRVLVDAHMDEVGLLITDVDSKGLLQFTTVGGFDDRALLGKVVVVGKEKVPGVIGARAVHLLKSGEYNKVVKVDSMRIDVGAKNKDAAAKVKVGDYAAFATEYEEIDGGRTAIGKAFDNRAGCAALIELLRGEPYPFDLIASFTVQEEIGLRGAPVAAYGARPDVALVLECTPAYDLPNKNDVSANVILGKGPSIYVMDSRTIQNPRLVAHIRRTAEGAGIPYQIRQPGGGGTNTGAIQRQHGGIPAATLATPARYCHSPVSMINLDDYANVVRLADATLHGLVMSEEWRVASESPQ